MYTGKWLIRKMISAGLNANDRRKLERREKKYHQAMLELERDLIKYPELKVVLKIREEVETNQAVIDVCKRNIKKEPEKFTRMINQYSDKLVTSKNRLDRAIASFRKKYPDYKL